MSDDRNQVRDNTARISVLEEKLAVLFTNLQNLLDGLEIINREDDDDLGLGD